MSMRTLIAFSCAAMLAGCAVVPRGPSVLVLPGTTKTFDQFRADDALCKSYAFEQVGGLTPGRAVEESVGRSAALGTVLGAAAGAAAGGSRGLAVGAGAGLVLGSLAGAPAAEASGFASQRRYDHSYVQCMYASGHRVPATFRSVAQSRPARTWYPPPPPPGYPPPR